MILDVIGCEGDVNSVFVLRVYRVGECGLLFVVGGFGDVWDWM